ncbi:MAG TPA: TlpA disulfide reductase family protein [Ilumatobacteraceae bacterium]|nr:TlpA disulfide reductase family protein [Ilumatobacteraceae bacterium]
MAPFVSLAVAAVVAVLFVVLANGKSAKPDVTSSFLLNRPAPAAISTTLDNKPFDLSRRKGSWVVLNFFQSTCLPCKAEHPELVAFAAQQASVADGAELYTVIKDDPDSAVAKWFAEHGGSWPIVKDDNGAIATAFGVAQVPETWIIDPSGVVVRRIPTTITADFLSTQLEQLRQAYG